MNIVHCKEKCEASSSIMRNAQMVSQKCALPAPVPWISPASVEQLTGKELKKKKKKNSQPAPLPLFLHHHHLLHKHSVIFARRDGELYMKKTKQKKPNNVCCCCNISSEHLCSRDILLVFINFVCRYDTCLDKNRVPLRSVWSCSLHHKCLVLKRLKEKLKLSCHFRYLTGGF